MRLWRTLILLIALTLPAAAAAQEKSTEAGSAEAVTPGVADTLPYIARLKEIEREVAARRYDMARTLAEPALAEASAALGDGHVVVGRLALQLGTALARLGDRAAARPHLQRALGIELRTSGRATVGFRAAFEEFIAIELVDGKVQAVAELYARLLDGLAKEKPEGTPAEAIYRDDYGNHLRRLGRFADAEREFRKAIALKERIAPDDGVTIARSLNNLAGLLRVVGRYDEASEVYERAIALWRRAEGGDSANVGILTDNLGVLYLNMGRLAEGEAQHREAVRIFERVLGPEHPTTAVGIANLAEAFRQLGRYDEAEPLFLRSLTILRRHARGPDQRIAVALDNLGGIYRERRNYAKALDSYTEALKIFLQIFPPEHPTVGVTTNNIGLALMGVGRLDEAAERFQRGLAIAETAYGPEHREVATQLVNIGDLQLLRGRHDEARAALTRGAAINTQLFGPQHERVAPPLILLGRVELAAGAPREAAAHLRRALAIEIASVARAGSLPGGRAEEVRLSGEAAGLLVEALWRTGGADDPQAQAEAFEAAQLASVTAAGRAIAKFGVRLAAGDGPLAVKIRLRQDLAGQRLSLDKNLIAAVSSPAAKRDATAEERLRSDVATIDKAISNLDAEIERAFPEFAALADRSAIPLDRVRTMLAANEVLLVPVAAGGGLHIFAVDRETVRWVRRDTPLATIADDIHRLRCGLDSGEWVGRARPERCLKLLGRLPENNLLPFDVPAARRLYGELFQPVETIVAGRHVLVAATGPLAALPIHVLVPEPPDEPVREFAKVGWLAARQPVTMLPSVASLGPLRAAPPSSAKAGKPYLGIANPLLLGPEGNDRSAFGRTACPPRRRGNERLVASARPASLQTTLVRGGLADRDAVLRLEPLPETTDEVCAIADVLGVGREPPLLGSEATEQALKALDRRGDLKRYRIVHFATHGLVAGDLEGLAEPALVLSPPDAATSEDDGLLMASEIATLKLDADWVILSACNTASGTAGDGEALSGLARAFFYAGARSLLVSHWPVRSDAAVRLTTAALAEIQKSPRLARSEALRRAMLALIADASNPTFAHPQVWAPFTVVGEGGGELVSARRTAQKPSKPKTTDDGADWRGLVFGRP
jgi:CHAT domain-containing protein/tetratricopeptide (TPR) repeat protein